MTDFRELCWDAVFDVDELEQADADETVTAIIERVIAVLPTRSTYANPFTSETWRLLLADAAARSQPDRRQGRPDPGGAQPK
jgi:hypothetical protein